jgi:hypothetical protein
MEKKRLGQEDFNSEDTTVVAGQQSTRRQFVVRATLAGAAALSGLGCPRRRQREVPAAEARQAVQGGQAQLDAAAAEARAEQAWSPFPYVDGAGTPEEVGYAVGQATAPQIRTVLERLRESFVELKQFALADRAQRLDPWLAAVERYHPEVLAEIRGMARGAGLPFEDLFIWNLQPELRALRELGNDAGCSTLQVNHGSRVLLVHNEDGAAAYREQMILLRLRPAGKPAVTCLAYPGLIPGQVPAATSAGLVFSTNFISTVEVRPGVPRYVLGRAALACGNLAEVVSLTTEADRAYAFTLHAGSIRERRLLCLELGPRIHRQQETRGLLVHTNHFILPGTRELPQRSGDRTGSSGSRLAILQGAVAHLSSPDALDEGRALQFLSSHEAVQQPYSPCRHPTPETHSQTLATAVFDVTTGSFALYEGNPCENRRRVIDVVA